MINKSKVKELLLSGRTQAEVASELGTTKQNVSLIGKKLKLERASFGQGLKVHQARTKKLLLRREQWGRDVWALDNIGRAQSFRFQRKRQNNRTQSKYEWNLEFVDIDWPTHCPALGIELDYFAEIRADNSPSFDRIDNSKGYLKGNVQIISWRANRIKNDGTKEEHLKIADWMGQIRA